MGQGTGAVEALVTPPQPGRLPDPAFWRGKRVLLTGHTGFKGGWLARWLAMLGAQTHGLALAPDSDPALFDAAEIASVARHRVGDIRDAAQVSQAVAEAAPDVILHLAAQALVRPSYAEPVGTFATNVMGTIHVMEAARAVSDLAALVVVSSDKCYENREWPWAYREGEAMGGYDPYSASKGACEIAVAAWRRSFFAGTRLGSGRAGNVIGGGDWAKDRLIPDLMRALLRAEAPLIRSPHAIRPWQHVLEPLCGYLLLAEDLAGGVAGAADGWNFGPAEADARPVAWICDYVTGQWGDGAKWVLDANPQPHEATYLKVDAAKARARLGWRPRLDLAHALDWTMAWYRAYDAGESGARLCDAQIERYCRIDVA